VHRPGPGQKLQQFMSRLRTALRKTVSPEQLIKTNFAAMTSMARENRRTAICGDSDVVEEVFGDDQGLKVKVRS